MRRFVLMLAVVAAAAAPAAQRSERPGPESPRTTAAGPPLAAEAGSRDWPQFRGNARLTGVAATPLPATLKVLWNYELGDMADASPAIVDGVVYAAAMNGTLAALDLASGKPR